MQFIWLRHDAKIGLNSGLDDNPRKEAFFREVGTNIVHDSSAFPFRSTK